MHKDNLRCPNLELQTLSKSSSKWLPQRWVCEWGLPPIANQMDDQPHQSLGAPFKVTSWIPGFLVLAKITHTCDTALNLLQSKLPIVGAEISSLQQKSKCLLLESGLL